MREVQKQSARRGTLLYKVDPDTAVCRGAAIFAETLSYNNSPEVLDAPTSLEPYSGVANKIIVSDVTSQSLGVITVDGYDQNKMINTIIIPHNTKIPTKKSVEVYTVVDNQTRIEVSVTEGNDSEVEYVKVIGNSLLDIPPYPKGSPVEIIYAYDADQTIFIEVIDKVSNNSLGTFEIDRTSNLSETAVSSASDIVGNVLVD